MDSALKASSLPSSPPAADQKSHDPDHDYGLEYVCPRCEQKIPSISKDEHDDWHFASDLQDEEGQNGTASTSQQPAVAVDASKQQDSKPAVNKQQQQQQPVKYAPPSYPPPGQTASSITGFGSRPHTNQVIEAARVRARDEQQMQNQLQALQFQYNIYNSEIEPEHDVDYWCGCPIHNYQRMKWNRYGVQEMWSKAVMYPGEKGYNDSNVSISPFGSNPYSMRVVSPYGYNRGMWGPQRPQPGYHAQSIHQTIALNNRLNSEAQANIDAREPRVSIWEDKALESAMTDLKISSPAAAAANNGDRKQSMGASLSSDRAAGNSNGATTANAAGPPPPKASRLSSFRKSIGIQSSQEREVKRTEKMVSNNHALRDMILAEEAGRWRDEQWRQIVAMYQSKVGMTSKIAALRAHRPIQYLHLLRAGYFEPIPVAWASQASNPLKFSIEAAAGWRGLTPAWRGYEDTAEERLYWVLNHRDPVGPGGGVGGARMKPDFISEMNMARARMATAVEPPPEYYSATDTCHVQHTSAGYSKQVLAPPMQAFDRPALPTDDTMILLDVSGSMDFDPLRPVYNQYLVTGYAPSTQPKNKDVARAVIRRFTDAMSNHDHSFEGYDLVTFSSAAKYVGTVNHGNLEGMWQQHVRFGGGTRVMTGWQMVKDLHFQKHSQSATHHGVYGWQAGPETPMLRLLLLLDGEATDMDEFELDLLGLSWAHVTIFLIGVDGCPHHHRHANELQRISDVNHHVSFVDAQGNTPERYVTHELLKRHLGYQVSMTEFEQMEELPGYSEH